MSGAIPGPCDAGIAALAPPRANLHPRATLAATILGSSVAFIDGSVVNVALPALARDLGASPEDLSWTINAYLLPLGALTLLGGAAGDHFGRRRLLLIGLAIFTSASILCAIAPVLTWLLVGRGLQGLGAALLMPNSLAILGAFQGFHRLQVMQHAGIDPGLDHAWPPPGRFHEAVRPGPGLIVEIPVERLRENQALRRLEAERMNIGYKDEKACQILPALHDPELRSLFDRVDRVAASVGEANDLGS